MQIVFFKKKRVLLRRYLNASFNRWNTGFISFLYLIDRIWPWYFILLRLLKKLYAEMLNVEIKTKQNTNFDQWLMSQKLWLIIVWNKFVQTDRLVCIWYCLNWYLPFETISSGIQVIFRHLKHQIWPWYFCLSDYSQNYLLLAVVLGSGIKTASFIVFCHHQFIHWWWRSSFKRIQIMHRWHKF